MRSGQSFQTAFRLPLVPFLRPRGAERRAPTAAETTTAVEGAAQQTPRALRRRAEWLFALVPLAAVVLIHSLLAAGPTMVAEGKLADPDAYMHLNRVVALHEAGDWFDPTYSRINPPAGHTQHWTRPFDALLLAGSWLISPALGFPAALHGWGVVLSPVLHALAVLVLFWAIAPVLDVHSRVIAGLAFAVQPAVITDFLVGRPDHHGLLLLLFVGLLGLFLRMVRRPLDLRVYVGAGAVTALSVWVSTEALVPVGLVVLVLGLYWLFGGSAWLRANLLYTGACTLFFVLALAIERGPVETLAAESDRLSIVHVALFALMTLFWAAVALVESGRGPIQSTAVRGAFAVLGAAGTLGSLLLLFPALAAGPLGSVDPLYEELRLRRILELQPLVSLRLIVSGAWHYAVAAPVLHLGIGLAAVPCLVVLLLRASGAARAFWALVGLGLLVFVPLGIYQMRWLGYAQALLALPYGALVAAVLRRLEREVAERWLVAVRPVATVLLLTWPVLAFVALPRPETGRIIDACPLSSLATFLEAVGDGDSKTVMTLADYGPELLYRTNHAVLAIPNHRPQPGFTATYRVLTSTDDAEAAEALRRHGVDWILLCPSNGERAFYGAIGQPAILYSRLVDNRGPAWLRPVELPAPLAEGARLFEFVDRDVSRSIPADGEAGAPR